MTVFKKTLRIVIIALAAIALLITIPNLVFRIVYADFFNKTEQVVDAPFSKGFEPRGLTEYGDGYLTVGKDARGNSTVRFFDGKKTYDVSLLSSDGNKLTKDYTGVSFYDEYLYLADGKERIDVFGIADFDGSKTTALSVGFFETPVTPAVLTVNNGYLYAANCYDSDSSKEKTAEEKTGDEKYGSCIISYRLDISQTKTFGIKRTPNSLYSVPDGVKGLCFTPEKIVLSVCSDGKNEVRAYNRQNLDYSKITIEDSRLNLNETVNRYTINEELLTNRVKTLPSTYDIAYSGKKVVILNCYASDKNFFGKFIFGLNRLYGYAI